MVFQQVKFTEPHMFSTSMQRFEFGIKKYFCIHADIQLYLLLITILFRIQKNIQLYFLSNYTISFENASSKHFAL